MVLEYEQFYMRISDTPTPHDWCFRSTCRCGMPARSLRFGGDDIMSDEHSNRRSWITAIVALLAMAAALYLLWDSDIVKKQDQQPTTDDIINATDTAEGKEVEAEPSAPPERADSCATTKCPADPPVCNGKNLNTQSYRCEAGSCMPNDPLMIVCEWGCKDGKCVNKPPCTVDWYKTSNPDQYNRFVEYAAELTERNRTEMEEAKSLFTHLEAAAKETKKFEILSSIPGFTAEDLQYIQTEYHIQAISDGKECYLDRSEKTSSTLVGKFTGTWAETLVYVQQSFADATTGDSADPGYWLRKKDWVSGAVVPSNLSYELAGMAEELVLKDEQMLRTTATVLLPTFTSGLSDDQLALIIGELTNLWSSLAKDMTIIEAACRENCTDGLTSCDWIGSEESGLSLDDAAALRFWLSQQGWRGVRDNSSAERAWIEYRHTHPEVVARANNQLLVLRFWVFYTARELGYEKASSWATELTPIIDGNKGLVLRDWYLSELKKQGRKIAPAAMETKTDYTVVSLEEGYAVIKKGDSGKPQMVTVGVKIEDKFTVKTIDRSTGVTLTLADGTEVILPPPQAEADDAETAPAEVPIPPPAPAPPAAPAGKVIILR